MQVSLPANLNSSSLRLLMKEWPSIPTILDVQFNARQWASPTGMVGLACLIERHKRLGGGISLRLNNCCTARYWQRMNFFDAVQCEVSIPPVVHHPANGRFAEMCQINDIEDVDELTSSLVKITKPSNDAEKVYSHILSEAMNNVCQHSGAFGFCAAQYWKKSGRIEFCIADAGCGLKEALYPAYSASDDAEAIGLAIRVGVTGRRPAKGQSHMRNRGVGLSCIERLVQANGGRFEIWSGLGRFTTASKGPHLIAHPWNGTLLMVNMHRDQLTADFHDVMRHLTEELRLVEASRKV